MDVCCSRAFVCILHRKCTVSSMATLCCIIRSDTSSRQSPDTGHSRLCDSVRHRCDCCTRVFSGKCFHTVKSPPCTAPVISLCHTDKILASQMDNRHTCRCDISLCIYVGHTETFCCTICHTAKSNRCNCALAIDYRTRN